MNKTVRQVSIHPQRVVFTAANWSRPALIYVAGLADEINEGGTHVAKLLHVARSKDENYDSSTSLLRSRSCNQSLTMALAEGRGNRTAHPDFVALMASATQLKGAPGTMLAQLCLNISARGKEAPTRLCCPQRHATINSNAQARSVQSATRQNTFKRNRSSSSSSHRVIASSSIVNHSRWLTHKNVPTRRSGYGR